MAQVVNDDIGPAPIRDGDCWSVQYPTTGRNIANEVHTVTNWYGRFDTRKEACDYIRRVWKREPVILKKDKANGTTPTA